MTCPICGGDTKVIDTAGDCDAVYRTRKCVECEYKFSTAEFEYDGKKILGKLRREMRIGKTEKEFD